MHRCPGPSALLAGGLQSSGSAPYFWGTMAFPLVKQRKFFPLRACTSLLIQNILCMHTGARKVFTFRSVVAGFGCRALPRLLPACAGAALRESIAVTCNWGFALQPLYFTLLYPDVTLISVLFCIWVVTLV